MIAYEFYRRHSLKGYQLIRVLPGRRRTPTRMTQASLMNWVKKVFNNYLRSNGIDFFQVLINEFPRKIFQPVLVLISQE
jgi:sulfatase maturation enzyme AslB (radical SAM superfamily)